MQNLFIRLILIISALSYSYVMAASVEEGRRFFENGHYKQAIEQWEVVLPQLSGTQQIDVGTQLAVAYLKVGQYPAAYTTLHMALSLAQTAGTVTQQTLIYSYLGDVSLALHQITPAKQYLEQGLTLARSLNEPDLMAHLYNHLGNVANVEKSYPTARDYYTQAITQAKQANNQVLELQALINQARTYLKQDDPAQALKVINTALLVVDQLPANQEKGFELISLTHFILRIQKQQPQAQLLLTAHQLASQALQLADTYSDKRLEAYAKMYLGQVYEQGHRYPEALRLTRESAFLSQGEPDLLYRTAWQRGRILQAQEDFEGAIAAYRKSLEYLQPIRNSLIIGQRDFSDIFKTRIRPVYFSLADVLLKKAGKVTSAQQKATLLAQARSAVEQLKEAELQDYFQDECITAAKTRVTKLDRLDDNTAVFYPILLPDRTELLLSLPDGIHQFSVDVSADVLTKTVIQFQKNLKIRTKWDFLDQSKQLYQWLIQPIRATLDKYKINTIVVVPDGALRMIPFAAMFDGENFLVHYYALATTPGLNLTDPRPLPRANISVLLNGLSEGVQNFSPLPNVPQEIEKIHSLFDKSSTLLNQEFSLSGVNHALSVTPYSIVHMASHGQFDPDPRKTFLLTYDDKLTMDGLERLLTISEIRKEPVELLTLSACQTAVGDERAALGLAGVAIKAGARSALASLWFVNDESTAQLVSEFYQQLQTTDLSKALALQKAQNMLIQNRMFRHPVYWAAFLLIGNWL